MKKRLSSHADIIRIQLLRRMYLMQVDAFGPEDKRCAATNEKIAMVQETGTVSTASGEKASSAGDTDEDDKEDSKQKPSNPVMKMFKKMSKRGK